MRKKNLRVDPDQLESARLESARRRFSRITVEGHLYGRGHVDSDINQNIQLFQLALAEGVSVGQGSDTFR